MLLAVIAPQGTRISGLPPTVDSSKAVLDIPAPGFGTILIP